MIVGLVIVYLVIVGLVIVDLVIVGLVICRSSDPDPYYYLKLPNS